MELELIRKIPLDELIERLRTVPLKKPDADGNPIFPYVGARITLRETDWREVNPTSFYLIEEGVRKQRDIRERLRSRYGIDPLHLDGAVEIANDEGELWTLTPPITEVTPRRVVYAPRDGELRYADAHDVNILILNDGLHRVSVAKENDEPFHAIHIAGALQSHPFYAHPNAWDLVKIVDKTPSDKRDRKLYSREDCYALYRDFGVLGCGAPRGKEGK